MSSVSSISLPQEVLVDDLFPKLSSLNLIEASCVCRLWRQCAFDPKLWKCFVTVLDKNVYEAKFGDIKRFGLSLIDLTPITFPDAIREAARFLVDLKRAGLTIKNDAGVFIVDVPRNMSFDGIGRLLGKEEEQFDFIQEWMGYSVHRAGSSRFIMTKRMFNESTASRYVQMPSLLEAHLVHAVASSSFPESIRCEELVPGRKVTGKDFAIIGNKPNPRDAMEILDKNTDWDLGIVGMRRIIHHDSALRLMVRQAMNSPGWSIFPKLIPAIPPIPAYLIVTGWFATNGSTRAVQQLVEAWVVLAGGIYYLGFAVYVVKQF